VDKHARAIIAAARNEIQEANSADPLGNLWTDAELLEWANEAQNQTVAEILDLDENFFGAFFEINTVANVAIYDLPSRFLRMKQVEYVGGGARLDVPESRARPGNPPVLSASLETLEGAGLAYALFNDQIHFDPPLASALTPGFRCWYIGDPQELTYGVASAGAASTITLQAAVSATGRAASGDHDYYNGVFLVLTGGTGVGQRRRVADYDGDTKVATVATPWSVTPNGTTLYATETVLPSPAWRIPQLFAAISAKGKYRQDARQLVSRLNALHDSLSSLERRTSTERGVEPFDPDDGL